MTKRTVVLLGVAFAGISAGPVSIAQEPARVFVTDSDSWQMTSLSLPTPVGDFKTSGGGARPQTVEIIKTVRESCRDVIVTNKQDMADFIMVLDHEGGKRVTSKDNKWVLFAKNGDAIGSGSTRMLGSSVKNACKSLRTEWAKKKQG